MVTEFFSYGVNTLLFQRGIYPPENFTRVEKYGLTLLVSTDPGVKTFMDNVLGQMKKWIKIKELKRVVVVVASIATREVLERWAFDVVLQEDNDENVDVGLKDERKIMGEIQAVIRQITASVSFLPLLEAACSFDMLIYTNQDTEVPAKWEESGAKIIKDREEVRLRSFSTSVHNVEASVSYARSD